MQIMYFDHLLPRHSLRLPPYPQPYFPLVAPLLKACMPFWNIFLSPLFTSRTAGYFYTRVQFPTVFGSSYLKGCALVQQSASAWSSIPTNLEALRSGRGQAEGSWDTPSARVRKLWSCGKEMINAAESPANSVSPDFTKTNKLELSDRQERLHWP